MKPKKEGTVLRKIADFMASKGYYIVLILCAAAVAISAFAASRSVGELPELPELPETGEYDLPSLEPGALLGGDDGEAETGAPQLVVEKAPEPEPEPEPEPQDESAMNPVAERASDAAYVLPHSGELLRLYTDGKLVFSETMRDYRTHDGIDIKAETGDIVYAAADGVVDSFYNDPLWGCVVVVKCDGYTMYYKGLSDELDESVAQNAALSKGQTIGYVGACPIETELGAHLHFELKKDGVYIDPLSIFN